MMRYATGDRVTAKQPLNCKGKVKHAYIDDKGVEMIVVEMDEGAMVKFPEADRLYFIHTVVLNADDVIESGTTPRVR